MIGQAGIESLRVEAPGGEAREEPSPTYEAVADPPQKKKCFHPARPYWTGDSKLDLLLFLDLYG